MNEEVDAVEAAPVEPARKPWEKPDLVEIPIGDVTASLFAVGGNDGSIGWSNIS